MSQSPHGWEALRHELHGAHPDNVAILHETLAFCGRLVDPKGPELCQTIENFNNNLQKYRQIGSEAWFHDETTELHVLSMLRRIIAVAAGSSISSENERLDWTRTFAENIGLCAALVNVHSSGGSDQDEGPDHEHVFETLFCEDLSGKEARLRWKRFLDGFETIQFLLPSRSLGMIENNLTMHLPTQTAGDLVVFVDEAEQLWSPPQTEADTFRFLIWCASESFHSEKLREWSEGPGGQAMLHKLRQEASKGQSKEDLANVVFALLGYCRILPPSRRLYLPTALDLPLVEFDAFTRGNVESPVRFIEETAYSLLTVMNRDEDIDPGISRLFNNLYNSLHALVRSDAAMVEYFKRRWFTGMLSHRATFEAMSDKERLMTGYGDGIIRSLEDARDWDLCEVDETSTDVDSYET